MRGIVTVTTPAESTALTTVERVKLEFGLTGEAQDGLLQAKVNEASNRVAAHLGLVPWRETVSETFRPSGFTAPDLLPLARTPVVSIDSVTEDGTAVDSSEYSVEPLTGLLMRLDSSGYQVRWSFCKSVVVAYAGGWTLPGTASPTLPPAIEQATVDLVRSGWYGRRRDPMLKAESHDGIGSFQYWVGSTGDAGELPPEIAARLAPFRRVLI